MKQKIGKFKSSIATLELHERVLTENTLIIAEPGSGKTHLANKIREFVIASGLPTLYLDFSDPDIEQIEERFKHGSDFHYMRFDESDEFNNTFDQAIAERKNIYMAVNPSYFASKREIKSKLSQTIQKRELMNNYYYFMQEIASLEGFYTKFEDFIFYIFDLVNLKKFGLTFLTQPHEIFENPRIKLIFSFLYIGRCSNAYYYNTTVLRNMKPYTFLYQHRVDNRSLLFNNIQSDIVFIDV
ncbi:MAG: ATP-binding protein [Sulfuricurvum sp.]|uniref:ATP-binding protein n=1 Tax=Sulfuricurvum sp. TaxID=2025608 RepID=UPI0026067736|nr:ATP-binding protein [Sulfuricurvum sp.]MDD4882995.1 ATP-binding protein [Sulfuricurvum sp.]